MRVFWACSSRAGKRSGKTRQLTYDFRYNIAYIQLREKSAEVETLRISDELNIDLAPDGTVYGIELLNATQAKRDMTAAPPH
jgi:uncharacterized protein YuzE